MSIVAPQFVCAYPAAPAEGLTTMGMSEKRVPPLPLESGLAQGTMPAVMVSCKLTRSLSRMNLARHQGAC